MGTIALIAVGIPLLVYLAGIAFFLWGAAYLLSGLEVTAEDRRMAASVRRNAWAWPLAYAEYGCELLRNRKDHHR